MHIWAFTVCRVNCREALANMFWLLSSSSSGRPNRKTFSWRGLTQPLQHIAASGTPTREPAGSSPKSSWYFRARSAYGHQNIHEVFFKGFSSPKGSQSRLWRKVMFLMSNRPQVGKGMGIIHQRLCLLTTEIEVCLSCVAGGPLWIK